MSDVFVTPWTVARQALLSTGFSRQEYLCVLLCHPPGIVLTRDQTLNSPALASGFFTTSNTWEALKCYADAKSLQSCPTLCDPIDGSPPGSTVPGILQARTLEWVAISFSNAWKVKSESEAAQSCLTFLDSVDCSPPGSSLCGIFQARVLEWGAIAFSWCLFQVVSVTVELNSRTPSWCLESWKIGCWCRGKNSTLLVSEVFCG